MTTLNASLPDKRFVAFRLKSNAGECDYSGLWRLRPLLTYECHPPTDWKPYVETGRASTTFASTTSGGCALSGRTGARWKSTSSTITEEENNERF